MKTCSRRDFVKLMGLAALSPMIPFGGNGTEYSSALAADRNTGVYDIKHGEVQIFPIDENTWRIQEDMVRCFLLAGTKEALLIDSGFHVPNMKAVAESLTDLPVKLLNTHADRDHVGGNNAFGAFYMSMAEASNYYHGENRTGSIIPLEHGDKLDLGYRELEIVGLPGHTPGSIAVLDVEKRVLISGDPIQDGNIYMFGVQRELHAYVLSLKRLEAYKDRFDAIYPAHGTCPVSPDLIAPLCTGVERILAGEVNGEEAVRNGIPIKKYDIGVATILGDA
ncbi:MAG: MBL fold metallo-hydrolase [Schwartzia sp.]|nr:MBL fold metallo-hydrolase [Schwartzia sp. (in: firmicutes)]